ncbi:hypothetical protein O980_24420 [Mycobacterium avium subsp. paratuberculosis 08-8281]|nr:hypothetical protein O980_24420 [Mycobacterium avium subsp. paratuberculosis 08-8281]
MVPSSSVSVCAAVSRLRAADPPSQPSMSLVVE